MAKIYITEDLCKGTRACSICIEMCPKKVFGIADRFNKKGVNPPETLKPEDCNGCEICMIYCPDLAIVIEK